MGNLKDKLKGFGLATLIALGIVGTGLIVPHAIQGLKELNEKIENSEYIKNIRKENKEKQKFQEEYLNAKKEDKITYMHCGYNIPMWYVDINGDKKFDGYILHVNGSTRGSNQIGLYQIKQE